SVIRSSPEDIGAPRGAIATRPPPSGGGRGRLQVHTDVTIGRPPRQEHPRRGRDGPATAHSAVIVAYREWLPCLDVPITTPTGGNLRPCPARSAPRAALLAALSGSRTLALPARALAAGPLPTRLRRGGLLASGPLVTRLTGASGLLGIGSLRPIATRRRWRTTARPGHGAVRTTGLHSRGARGRRCLAGLGRRLGARPRGERALLCRNS